MTERDPGDSPADRPASAAGRAPGEAPHLDESIRRIRAAGSETFSSGLDSGRALRKLFSADFALSRSALGRALAWSAVSVVFGASAWLLAMGAAIAFLQSWGMSWLGSISIATLISLIVTAIAAWRVSVFFDYAGMHATRRQLSRLGLFNESVDDDGDDDLPTPTTGTSGPDAPRATPPA
ncbi:MULTISPECIES: phage holin family protein [Luteimonas]|jgi:hypothetical protein|uniref:phage holin family protein n=1 Tax=Luteimonas TaxID=83614 RepID=UPI000C7BA215|nr:MULTISPECIES: phage holin family protein [Luteimonas]